ncbi:LAGLIDADG family homing endonuclease [Streptomyces althioticus]|uniref:LAGLIDADG family homing endonuclease n=1 Tax=Streptomyces TaxID=1883 RepID=UPI0033E88217
MDLTVPEYAYMFGFLQADGHLSQQSRKRGRLTVEVNARDIDLRREFQRLTPCSSSIPRRNRSTNFAEAHTSALWGLLPLEARTILNDLGLPYGRKSRSVAPPREAFSGRDYLRGVVDADGSVGYTSKGFPFVSLTTASTAIGRYLCAYVQEVAGVRRTIARNARDGIYNVLIAMEAGQRLAADLYYPGGLTTRAASRWPGNRPSLTRSPAGHAQRECGPPTRRGAGARTRTECCCDSAARRRRPRYSAALRRAAISGCGGSGPVMYPCPTSSDPV